MRQLALSQKLLLLAMGPIVVLLGLGWFALRTWVQSEVEVRSVAQLERAGALFDLVVSMQRQRLTHLAAATAAAPRFKAAVDDRDAGTVREALADELDVVATAMGGVVDSKGLPLAWLMRGGDEGALAAKATPMEPAELPGGGSLGASVIRDALGGRSGVDVWRVGKRLVLVATHPLETDGQNLGALTLGTRLDSAVALQVDRMTEVDLIIASPDLGTTLASSLGGPTTDTVLGLLADDLGASPPGGSAAKQFFRVSMAGEVLKVVRRPILDAGGGVVAWRCLVLSESVATEVLRRVQWLILGASGLLALVGLGLARVMAGAVTRPVASLIQSTRRVAEGDLETAVPVEGDDEIGVLARRFDEMRRAVKLSIEERLEAERLRSSLELERHRSLSQMVAGVAHEINTPLGVVNQAASLLAELLPPSVIERTAADPALSESLRDAVEAAQLIVGNIHRASSLIQTFKSLSVRQITDRRESVDLRIIIDEVLDLWRLKAKSARLEVQFHCDLEPDDRQWDGFPGYLGQVLLNLLTNVERYAYPGGGGGKVDVDLALAPQGFRLGVRDHGVGIPQEHQGRVFEVFFTTGRDRGGTGLGLAIIQNLVTGPLGGTIRFESTAGKGTCFTVEFPRRAPGVASDDDSSTVPD